MLNRHGIAAISALLAVFGMVACGGGGGGYGPATSIISGSSSPTTPPSNSPSSSPSSGSVITPDDTWQTGSVGAPAPASFGDAPLPAQIATSGGPTFDGISGSYPINVSFPALSSSLQFTSSGVSAVSTNQSANVTVSTSAGGSDVQLIVPSVNLDVTWHENVNLGRPTKRQRSPSRMSFTIA